MSTNTLTALTAEQQTFYDRALIKRATANLVWNKYGQKRPIPAGKGRTIDFRKFNALDAATTPLTEGVTPSGKAMNITNVTATLSQYGDFIESSDILLTDGIDKVAVENCEVLGEQAEDTLEKVTRDVVTAGTNVLYANGVVGSANVASVLTGADVKKAVRALRNANTKPAEGRFFVGLIDPDTEYDLTNDPDFKDVSKYNGGEQIMAGEVGKLHGVHFVVTTNTKVKEVEGKYIHCTMIIGKDAYGVVDHGKNSGGRKPSVIVKPVGSSGTADPLNQRGTQGWKADHTAVRLNELAMIRIEHLVTE